ncbi:MAG: MmgE/PrpD family protein [Clostridia bacterium]|nr:MmgE/PrpD family protein [Clostridia bacterium]
MDKMDYAVGLTEKIIQYTLDLTYDKIPQQTIAMQNHCINDILGCLLGATTLDDSARQAALYAERQTGPCTILYNGKKTTPEMAALANGTLAHALDFDDGHDAIVHPSGVAFPALLAIAEYLGNVSGEDFITALVIGTDLSCRFAMGMDHVNLEYGWNHPSIMQEMGAVFGASKLMGLDHDQILDAIALAMTQFTCSGESMTSKGSVIRTMRDGFAAQAVVSSVIMAKMGVHARFDTPFEGKYGFYTMYMHGEWTPEKVIKDLGVKFETDNITFKPWPSCKATHTSIQAMQEIMDENNLTKDDVESVHVVGQKGMGMTIDPIESKRRPESTGIAKASLPFVIGTILNYHDVNLTSFTEAKLKDEAIIEQGMKVSFEAHPTWGKPEAHFIDMTVKTNKGEFTKHIEQPTGGTGYPLTDDQVKNKFVACVKFYHKNLTDEQIDKLFEVSYHVDKLANVNELLALL